MAQRDARGDEDPAARSAEETIEDQAAQDLVQMATENAKATLESLKAQWQADTNRQTQALAELQDALNLSQPPNRIECYDISNTQGTSAVGSMVVHPSRNTPH